MFKKYLSTVLIALSLTISFSSIQAHETSDPLVVLEGATTEIIKQVKAKQPAIDRNPDLILELIEEIVFPHVDFDYMSRWVIGRSMWKKASDKDRLAFRDEFKVLLLRTYANVVREYANEKIVYYPIRADYDDKKRIQISSSITQTNRDPIDVVYRLVLSSDGEWKLYDIVIEGVSLLKGFQSQFYDTLRQSGLAGLVIEVRQHNLDDKMKREADLKAKQKEVKKGDADVGA
ncbi:MAG: hypothetical protein CMF48_05285 [Legionellales bacterium]|nr:hypothetical protein [Legionellales bacterium]|tara:strand:- start:593 stop:1288 length:696 start_codon:yes stop_codon:yes gene_type:complete